MPKAYQKDIPVASYLWLRTLADPTRRAMGESGSRGPASLAELLAKPLSAVVQHLRVLEATACPYAATPAGG